MSRILFLKFILVYRDSMKAILTRFAKKAQADNMIPLKLKTKISIQTLPGGVRKHPQKLPANTVTTSNQ